MRIAVVGSRSFNDYETFCIELRKVLKDFDLGYSFVSGGCSSGADAMIEIFALEFFTPIEIFYPDWKKFGKRAGFVRNVDIVNNSDVVIAFWDGISKGTANTIDLAKSQQKQVYIIGV